MDKINGVCIVVGLTVALERTLVMVKYEEKRKIQCTIPEKMLLFRVKIIVVASSVSSARPAEVRRRGKRRKKKIQFSTHVGLQL